MEVGERNSDLHTHSVFSDGELSVELIIDLAKDRNIKYISITDHENTHQFQKALSFVKDKNINISVIPGTEISTQLEEQEIHLVVYYHPEKADKIEDFVKPIKEAKKVRVYRILEKLRNMKLPVNEDRILSNSRSLNRMCVARYLYQNGYSESVKDAFRKILDREEIKNIKVKYPNTLDTARYLSEIGCFVGIAHPDFIKKFRNLNMLEKLVVSGCMGIEVFHPIVVGELQEKVYEYAKQRNLVILGGSDFHGFDSQRRELGFFNTFDYSSKVILEYINI